MREALARADHDFTMAEERPARRARPRKSAKRGGGVAAWLRARPSATLGAAALTALLIGVAFNALVLQKDRHPAPLFAGATPSLTKPPIEAAAPPAPPTKPAEVAKADPVPAPAPAAKTAAREETKKDAIASLIRTGSIERAPAAAAGETKKDSIGALLKAGNPVPPAGIPPSESKTVMTAQKALAKLGYGVKPDGVLGASTRQAIERFERDRKMPITGDLSARNLRELASLSGVSAAD